MTEVVLELFEDDEELRHNIIQIVEETIHKLLGQSAFEVQELRPQFVQEDWTRCLFNLLLVNDFFEALTFCEPQKVLGHVSQINVFTNNTP